MRLLLGTPDMHPNTGGVATYCHEFAAALGEAGADVTLLAPPGSVQPNRQNSYELVSLKVPRASDCIGPSWVEDVLPELRHRLERFSNTIKPDRIIALHPHVFGQIFTILGSELGIPTSVVFHGNEIYRELLLQNRIMSIRQACNNFRPTMYSEIRRVAKCADELLANSHFTAGLLRRYARGAEVRVTGCGAPKALMTFNPGDSVSRKRIARERLGIGARKKIVCTLCRLVPGKGVSDLLKSVQSLPDVHLLVVGDGPCRRRLTSLSEDLGVDNRVTWTGYVSDTEKTSWLECADVFCLLPTSREDHQKEGFGIVFLEAAAVGTPIVGTNNGGIRDFIEHEKTGLIAKESDPKSIAIQIEKILENPKNSMKLVESMRNRIKEKYNWDHIAKESLRNWY